MTNFLPTDYKAPVTSGHYMRFQPGVNHFRILSAPILGWIDWHDKKPVRYRYNKKPEKPYDPKRAVRHFWAMIVWNYKEQKIQILEVTQASIRNDLEALYNNEDWGAPYFYDIKITRKGESVETEYSIAPCPKVAVSKQIRQAFESAPCYLEALFEGGDPFEIDPIGEVTQGVFDENQVGSGSGMEAIRRFLLEEDIDSSGLEKFIAHRSTEKKTTPERILEAVFKTPEMLKKFAISYRDWLDADDSLLA